MTETAFILAAGMGTRMQPLTNKIPKPMVDIAGKPIIKHIIDECKKVGIKHIIINVFYKRDIIINYLKNETDINISFSIEDEILETGGGVKNALNLIEEDDFLLINGDAFWQNSDSGSSLEALKVQWNPDLMDICLLLEPVKQMLLTPGVGDYDLTEDSQAIRSKNKTGQFMFTGIRMTKKSVFKETPDGPFSFLTCMDEAESKKKLYGLRHVGHWHHISTPEDLRSVSEALNGA